jgi:hypothetical protein
MRKENEGKKKTLLNLNRQRNKLFATPHLQSLAPLICAPDILILLYKCFSLFPAHKDEVVGAFCMYNT